MLFSSIFTKDKVSISSETGVFKSFLGLEEGFLDFVVFFKAYVPMEEQTSIGAVGLNS